MATQQKARMVSTWKAVVRMALMSLGGTAPLQDIYTKVAQNAPERLAANPSWQAKVRQVLNQSTDSFAAVERGVWQLAA